MTRDAQSRCVVSFKGQGGNIDCRQVLLPTNTPTTLWTQIAREALYRQHDIAGASVKSVRVCADKEGEADYLVVGDDSETANLERAA